MSDREERGGLDGVLGKVNQTGLYCCTYSVFLGEGTRSMKQTVSRAQVARAGAPPGKKHCPRSQKGLG